MAGYRTHISVSGALGAAYGASAAYFLSSYFTPVQGALAGVLTWVAGMLPDVDSDSGKPVREVFGLLAAVTPFAMMGHLLQWGGNSEGAMLLAICVYGAIRYGGSALLSRLSVHRGMFHSIPAMLIAADLAFLAYKSDSNITKLLMAVGVALGFFSHLLLDEIYAVEWSGVRIKLNKFAGSAIKLAGNRLVPNVFTYSLLMVMTYAALVQSGLVKEPGAGQPPHTLQQAVEEKPTTIR